MSWRSAYAIDNPSGQIGLQIKGNQLYSSNLNIFGNVSNGGVDVSGNLFSFNNLPVGAYVFYLTCPLTLTITNGKAYIANANISITDGTITNTINLASFPHAIWACSNSQLPTDLNSFSYNFNRILSFNVTTPINNLTVFFSATMFGYLNNQGNVPYTINFQFIANGSSCIATKLA